MDRKTGYQSVHYTEIDSTNEEAKRRFLEGERSPLFISADYQSKGKGRNGRSFYSPHDTGIYFTYLYPCEDAGMLKEMIFVTTVSAVLVCNSLRKNAHVDAGIKWVNDVYVNKRKVCGILAEAVFRESTLGVIVGIGINLSTKDFPTEIENTAGNLGEYSEEELTRLKAAILKDVGDGLTEFFRRFSEASYRKEIIEEYSRMSLVIGKKVFFCYGDEEQKEGVAKAVTEEGGLVVLLPDGSSTVLNSGEIHLHTEPADA